MNANVKSTRSGAGYSVSLNADEIAIYINVMKNVDKKNDIEKFSGCQNIHFERVDFTGLVMIFTFVYMNLFYHNFAIK